MDMDMDLRTLRVLGMVAGIPGWQRMDKVKLATILCKILDKTMNN